MSLNLQLQITACMLQLTFIDDTSGLGYFYVGTGSIVAAIHGVFGAFVHLVILCLALPARPGSTPWKCNSLSILHNPQWSFDKIISNALA